MCQAGVPGHLDLRHSMLNFKYERQAPQGRLHHRSIEESEHRHDSAEGIVDAVILQSKGIEHHAACVQRHRHDQQHPPVQEQGVLGYALGIDLGGHGFEFDDWGIDLSGLD